METVLTVATVLDPKGLSVSPPRRTATSIEKDFYHNFDSITHPNIIHSTLKMKLYQPECAVQMKKKIRKRLSDILLSSLHYIDTKNIVNKVYCLLSQITRKCKLNVRINQIQEPISCSNTS